jgi:hypothetical protein
MHGGHNHPLARGDNTPPTANQWQLPGLSPGRLQEAPSECDLDLVEASFVEAFMSCKDPTSLLRLADIPFVGIDANQQTLHLLRVEIEDLTDVGSAMPLLGGDGMRYDPLPARLVSRRRRLRFAYHNGAELVILDFAAARSLT